jgi:hypothetical protein
MQPGLPGHIGPFPDHDPAKEKACRSPQDIQAGFHGGLETVEEKSNPDLTSDPQDIAGGNDA